MNDLSPLIERVQEMMRDLLRGVPNIIVGLLVFGIVYLLSSRIRTTVAYLLVKSGRSQSASIVFGRMARWLTILVGLLVALTLILPSFAPAQLIEFLGIGSVAIGFAFRDILQNFLSGVLLLLTEPFRIGDQIKIDDFEGTVDDIQIRATIIRTYDGKQVVIPNTILFTSSVTVNTAYTYRRTEYDIGIGYSDDIQRARLLILDAIQNIEGIQTEPAPDILVVELGSSSVNIRVRWWTDSKIIDVLQTQDRVIEAIKIKLYENGIDLPFPTQQILFHDQTEETDGDRTRQREGWPAAKEGSPKSAQISKASMLIQKQRSNSIAKDKDEG